MKTVNDDPYEFFKEGGWTFLQGDDDVRYLFRSFRGPSLARLSSH